MNKYMHVAGKLFYLDTDIPTDVTEVRLESGGVKIIAKKLFWRFYWLI